MIHSMTAFGRCRRTVSDKDITVEIGGEVFLSKSMLNSIRRDVCEKLEEALVGNAFVERHCEEKAFSRRNKAENMQKIVTCISAESAGKVKADYVSIPLSEVEKNFDFGTSKFGVTLPRVIYSSEMKECERLLAVAKQKGASFALVSNIGHIDAVKKSDLSLFGNIGMNVFNSRTIGVLENMGFELVTVSPELNEAQIRDLCKKDETKLCAFVKGRLPLMVLESCIVRAGGKCKMQNSLPCSSLCDRMNMNFPVYGEKRLGKEQYPCRNIIYNSVETDLLSKNEKMQKMNVDAALIYTLE